jgi:hypothetical protein
MSALLSCNRRGRRLRSWTYGASDLLLAGAAIGAGFAFIEDAYILHRLGIHAGFGLSAALAWFPTAAVEGSSHIRYIAGHGIWTGLAGMALGLGLLLRDRKILAIPLGAGGIAWSLLDHIRTNYTNHFSDRAADALRVLTANGALTLFLFAVGAIAVVVVDLAISLRTLPSWPQFCLRWRSPRGFADAWAREINRRALAYLVFRVRKSREVQSPRLLGMIARVGLRFIWERYESDPSLVPTESGTLQEG